MKIKSITVAVVLLASSFGFARVSSAQSCDNVANPVQGSVSTAQTSFSGNNCNNNSNFTKICANGDTLGGGGIDIISFTLGASYNNVQFTLQSAAFTPNLAIIGSPCSSSTSCPIDNGAAGPGSVSGTLPAALSPGTYYVFVANTADAACGAYNLSFTGTLPVKLQKFSVN